MESLSLLLAKFCFRFNIYTVRRKFKQKIGCFSFFFEHCHFSYFSPPHAPSVASDSDFTASSDCESEFGYYSAANKRKTRPGLTRQNLMSEERLQRVAEFAAQLSPPRSAGISSFVGQYYFFQINF